MKGYIREMRELVGHRTIIQCAASIIVIDENNMTSTIEIDHLDKTSVKFGFKPENVEYIGKVNIKDLEEEEEEEE